MKADFTADQLKRVDEVQDAVLQMCRVLCNEPNMTTEGGLVSKLSDLIADVLADEGKKVYYPTLVKEPDGNEYMEEYRGMGAVMV